jgi:hypothetical protein
VQYKAESADSLAHTLETLAADKQLTKTMKAKAHDVSLQFDISHQYKLFAKFIEDVTANAA